MSIDDEYAAIGIDLRSLRRGGGALSFDPADNPVETKLGLALLRLRLYQGWSQKTVEDRATVDQTVISRLECGSNQGLSIRRLFAILRALRVGAIVLLPRPPASAPTDLELMLRGDRWARAKIEADKRLSRRRSA
jgi:transcriptional regulator with XRE-family HTH domain